MFKLDTSGNETVLHSFAGTPDGASPERGFALDTKGNIHGATAQGGAYNYGTVFKLDTSGNETVLYSFTGLGGGSEPVGVLLLAAQGNARGTTDLGGTYGYGTVFKLDKKGNETVSYSFTGAADGANPRLLWLTSGGKASSWDECYSVTRLVRGPQDRRASGRVRRKHRFWGGGNGT